jgi:hypothetical protein
MYCKKCGAEVKPGEYCPKCGTKFEESNQITKENQGFFQRLGTGKKVVLIAGSVFIIFILFGIFLGNNSSSGNTYGLSANQIQSQATPITGDALTANYTNLVGKPIKIQGEVSSLQTGQMLMFTGHQYNVWGGEPIYVNIIGNNPSNLLDNDIVTVYGVVNGKTTYNTAIGGTNTVPEITIYSQNIQLNGNGGS